MVFKIFSSVIICSTVLFSNSVSKVEFKEIGLAKSEQEKKMFRLSESLSVTRDSKTTIYPIKYETLIYSGNKIKGSKYPFGTILNIKGEALKQKDGSFRISTSQDSNSIVYDKKDVYLITHLENSIGAMAKTKLTTKDNKLKVISSSSMDFSQIDGINNVCAGSTTPWNTHLGGEESNAESIYADKNSPLYLDCKDPLNSSESFCKTKLQLQKYLKDKEFNVYEYGYIVEAAVENSKDLSARHYLTGKYAPEMATVTKDNKTIYISDDGENCGFFKLVLDKEVNSFTKNWTGTLYAAKLVSKDGTKMYDIEWIRLGHSSDHKLKEIVSSRPGVTDFFDISLSAKDGYTKIDGEDTYYIKIKEYEKSKKFKTKDEFMQGLAFLESRKYATVLGASVDIRKEEGVTYDKKNNKLFLAISRIPNNECGAVYELDLDKNFSAHNMNAIAVGKVLKKGNNDYDKYKDEYYCHPDYVANPDNIAYIGNDILLIGEDTGLHFNNMVFAYNTKDKSLTRIATLPSGGEVTGLENAFVKDKKVVFINTQHPFDDVCSAADQKSNCNSDILKEATHDDLRGFTGYIDGLPKDVF